jgi:hypothetical protein
MSGGPTRRILEEDIDMRPIALVAVSISLVGLFAAVHAEEPLTRRDTGGGVTVTVTLLGWPPAGGPLRAQVVLDTHSVDLDAVSFERSVVLRTAGEMELAPAAVEQATGGGHHREAVVVFAADPVHARLVVRDVGGVAERIFTWDRPQRR